MMQQPPTLTPEQAPEELQSSAKKRIYIKPAFTALQPPELWKDDIPKEFRSNERDQ
jgi:hypothetical protein